MRKFSGLGIPWTDVKQSNEVATKRTAYWWMSVPSVSDLSVLFVESHING